MHYSDISTNYPWLPHNVDPINNPVPDEHKGMKIQPLGNQKDIYTKYLDGCVQFFGKDGHRCLESEKDRLRSNLEQPQSMKNYTKLGYTKIRAPEQVFQAIKEFWDLNRNKSKPESTTIGYVFT